METLPHSQIDRQQVIDRLAKLNSARAQLKKEFIGIDRVIDELMDSISTWYTLPELQTRPLVVNLWGMTGTGKTSLIRRLADVLEMNKTTCVMDLGNSGDSREFFNDLDEVLKNESGKPFMLMLDEFQHARTIDNLGAEKNFGKIGNIWKLIDTGIIEDHDYPTRQIECVNKHLKHLRLYLKKGVVVKRGMVVKGHRTFHEIAGTLNEAISDRDPESKDWADQPFYPDRDHDDIMDISNGRFTVEWEVAQHLKTLDGPGTVAFLEALVAESKKITVYDCSKSLIVIAGNLDEAYLMSRVMNPDIPAEVWKKMVRDIGITEVKEALRSRFRAEHIARLGNNHIIYPAMGDKEFKMFISTMLDSIAKEFFELNRIRLSFSSALQKVIYTEGVYPTQGFRPVITTIDQMVKCRLSIILGHTIMKYTDTDSVELAYKSKKLIIRFFQKVRLLGVETQPLLLNLTERRKLKRDDNHALVAVHEAGHVVCGSLLLNEIPDVAVSVTSGGDAGGFVIRSGENGLMQRSRLICTAAFMLGGYVAEKLIFGKDALTTGSTSDISRATGMVRSTLEGAGFEDGPIGFQSVKGFDMSQVIDRRGRLDSITTEYLKEAELLAQSLLKEERMLLLAMADGLFQRGTLTGVEIKRIIERYAVKKADERVVTHHYKDIFNRERTGLRPLQKVA